MTDAVPDNVHIAELRAEAADLRVKLAAATQAEADAKSAASKLEEELESARQDKLLMLGGLAQLATDLRHAYANLSETQKRCTDLLNQSKEPDDREKRLLKEAAEKANNALFGSMPIDVEHLISSHPEDMPRALRQACAAIEAAMVPLQEIIQARLEVG